MIRERPPVPRYIKAPPPVCDCPRCHDKPSAQLDRIIAKYDAAADRDRRAWLRQGDAAMGGGWKRGPDLN